MSYMHADILYTVLSINPPIILWASKQSAQLSNGSHQSPLHQCSHLIFIARQLHYLMSTAHDSYIRPRTHERNSIDFHSSCILEITLIAGDCKAQNYVEALFRFRNHRNECICGTLNIY